jgi:hypothetical protein
VLLLDSRAIKAVKIPAVCSIHFSKEEFMRSLLLIAVILSAPAMALDLKGVQLGQPASDTQLAALGCLPVQSRAANCFTSLGEVKVQARVLLALDGTVETIIVNFSGDQVPEIAKAGTAKWGKPKTDSTPMQNGFGAQVTLKVWMWTEPAGANATLYSLNPEHMDQGVLLLSAHAAKAPSAVL